MSLSFGFDLIQCFLHHVFTLGNGTHLHFIPSIFVACRIFPRQHRYIRMESVQSRGSWIQYALPPPNTIGQPAIQNDSKGTHAHLHKPKCFAVRTHCGVIISKIRTLCYAVTSLCQSSLRPHLKLTSAHFGLMESFANPETATSVGPDRCGNIERPPKLQYASDN